MTVKRRDFFKAATVGAAGAVLALPSAASAAIAKPADADKAFPAWTEKPYVHWSAHVSLYSAKTRAYMIKKGINFTETTPSTEHPRWKDVIKKEMGFFAIPVLDLPDGTYIQDTTAIIRYLEEKHPEPSMQPKNSVMRALAWLIFNYGNMTVIVTARTF